MVAHRGETSGSVARACRSGCWDSPCSLSMITYLDRVFMGSAAAR